MDEGTHPSCDLCQAVVPRNLTHFHRLWHKSQMGRSTPFFGDQDVGPEVAQVLRVVAALRAMPPVTAAPEFVRDLRERLMAETLSCASGSLSAAVAHSEDR